MTTVVWDALGERLAVFFRWWGGELWSLMPLGFRQRHSNNPEKINVNVSAKGETTPALEGLKDGQHVELHLEPEVVLSHDIRLPIANHRTTESMATIQMGRIMPLPLSDLYTDWRTGGPIENLRDGVSQQKVYLYVAKKKVLDPVFATIRSKKILLNDIRLDGAPSFSTLAPLPVRRHFNQRTLQRVGLGIVGILLLLMMPYAWLWNIRSENEIVSQEWLALQDVVSGVSESRDILDDHRAQVTFLANERSSDRFPEALALLSAESPDSVLLRDLNYERGTVRVAGYAESAAEWALTLGKLPAVRNVNLQRVSSGRLPSDSENFDIVIELEDGTVQ